MSWEISHINLYTFSDIIAFEHNRDVFSVSFNEEMPDNIVNRCMMARLIILWNCDTGRFFSGRLLQFFKDSFQCVPIRITQLS